MSPRVITGIGVALVAFAALALFILLSDGETDPTTSTTMPTTTSDDVSTSTTSVVSSTTSTSLTTTTVDVTSTTASSGVSTTFGVFDEVAAIEAFVDEFAAAVSAGDADFLFDRLHPAVKATYDEDVCRAYIEEEILSLEDYRATGPVTGPFASEFEGFQVTTYEVAVAFTFEDVDFDSSASYSLTEGVVRWFARCDQG